MRLLTFMLLAIALATPARALETAPATSPRAVVTLVTGHGRLAPGQPFRLGLRMRLAPGWHTYGRTPATPACRPN